MEETKSVITNKIDYFTLRHLLFYSMLIPPIIFNYLIFNLVLNNSENLNMLFDINKLVNLIIFFSISFSFAGISLFFLKRTYEIIFVSIILTVPVLFVKLSLDQAVITIFASLITFFASGTLIKNKTQKYIVANLKEQICSSFRVTTLLLNLSLTFIFFTQVSLITFDTWIGNINRTCS